MIPKLQIELHVTQPQFPNIHVVRGWEELDQWARMNSPIWAATTNQTDQTPGMTELDKLRLLASELLEHSVRCQKSLTDSLMYAPDGSVFVVGKNLPDGSVFVVGKNLPDGLHILRPAQCKLAQDIALSDAIDLSAQDIAKSVASTDEFIARPPVLRGEEMVEAAQAIATKAHAGQKRRGGADYITHPAKVVALLKDESPVVRATAWLHDVLEDTSTTSEHLRQAGIPEVVVRAVQWISRDKSIPYELYLGNVIHNGITRKVKKADILHNLSDAPSDKQRIRYESALQRIADFERKQRVAKISEILAHPYGDQTPITDSLHDDFVASWALHALKFLQSLPPCPTQKPEN